MGPLLKGAQTVLRSAHHMVLKSGIGRTIGVGWQSQGFLAVVKRRAAQPVVTPIWLKPLSH